MSDPTKFPSRSALVFSDPKCIRTELEMLTRLFVGKLEIQAEVVVLGEAHTGILEKSSQPERIILLKADGTRSMHTFLQVTRLMHNLVPERFEKNVW